MKQAEQKEKIRSPMRKIGIGILIAALFLGVAFTFGVCASVVKRAPFGGGKLGLIKIEGTIVTADKVLEQLEDARLTAASKASFFA